MPDTTPVADFDCDEFGRITVFRKVVNYQGASVEEVRPGMIRVCLPTPDGGEDIIVINGAAASIYGHRMQTWTGGVTVVGGDLAAIDERGRSQGTLVAEVEVGEPAPFRVITGLADAPAVYTKAPRPPSEHDTRLDVVNTDSPPPHDEV